MNFRYHRPGPNERGFALLLAVVISFLLLTSTMLLLQQATSAVGVAGGGLILQRTRYIAEAGVAWGSEELYNLTHPGGVTSLSQIQALPRMPPQDPLCGDGADCTQFFRMTPNPNMPFAEGAFTVAVTCYPSACTTSYDQVLDFEMRTLATLPSGARQLVEVSYLPN